MSPVAVCVCGHPKREHDAGRGEFCTVRVAAVPGGRCVCSQFLDAAAPPTIEGDPHDPVTGFRLSSPYPEDCQRCGHDWLLHLHSYDQGGGGAFGGPCQKQPRPPGECWCPAFVALEGVSSAITDIGDPGPVPDGPAPELTSAIIWLPELDEGEFLGGPAVSGFPLRAGRRVMVWPAVVQRRIQPETGPPVPLDGVRLGIDTIRRAFVVEVDGRKVWIAIDAAAAVLEVGRRAQAGEM